MCSVCSETVEDVDDCHYESLATHSCYDSITKFTSSIKGALIATYFGSSSIPTTSFDKS